MLPHWVNDTELEIFHGILVGPVYSPIIAQMKPPLILPMDSRLMRLSRARGRGSNPSHPGVEWASSFRVVWLAVDFGGCCGLLRLWSA